ncbi:hypothetical protein [Vulcanococcus limneticus]
MLAEAGHPEDVTRELIIQVLAKNGVSQARLSRVNQVMGCVNQVDQ